MLIDDWSWRYDWCVRRRIERHLAEARLDDLAEEEISFTRLRARCDVTADRSDRGQPNRCPRRYSLINRMGPCSRTPSGSAVSTDCINRPHRRLHPTNATASINPLQRGSRPQRTSSDRPACRKSAIKPGHRPKRKSRPKSASNLEQMIADHVAIKARFDFRRWAMNPTSMMVHTQN